MKTLCIWFLFCATCVAQSYEFGLVEEGGKKLATESQFYDVICQETGCKKSQFSQSQIDKIEDGKGSKGLNNKYTKPFREFVENIGVERIVPQIDSYALSHDNGGTVIEFRYYPDKPPGQRDVTRMYFWSHPIGNNMYVKEVEGEDDDIELPATPENRLPTELYIAILENQLKQAGETIARLKKELEACKKLHD